MLPPHSLQLCPPYLKRMKSIQTDSIKTAVHDLRKANIHHRTPKPSYLQRTTQHRTISTTQKENTPTNMSLVLFPYSAPDVLIIRSSSQWWFYYFLSSHNASTSSHMGLPHRPFMIVSCVFVVKRDYLQFMLHFYVSVMSNPRERTLERGTGK